MKYLAALFLLIPTVASAGFIERDVSYCRLIEIGDHANPVASISADGILSIREGMTVEDAVIASVSAFNFKPGLDPSRYTCVVEFAGKNYNSHHNWDICLKPGGTVDYAGIIPSAKEQAFYSAMASYYADLANSLVKR